MFRGSHANRTSNFLCNQTVLCMQSFKYKAFISYSHADEAWARWLHKALETYRIPKRIVREKNLSTDRLSPIFRDRDELTSASSLSKIIQSALADAEYLIVICSRKSAESLWVDQEIRHFKSLGRSGRVIYMLVDDPNESFPKSATIEFDQQGHETSTAVEPLAADARAGFDGKGSAKLKLVASMIGIGLDQLIRRDAARRQKRLVAIAAAAIVGMAFTSILAMYAVTQRDLAEEQRAIASEARDQAVVERDRAEVARAEAEEVVDFLIGMYDMYDPGTTLGNEVTAKQVLGRGVETVRSDLDEHPLTQARLFSALGSVYEALGLFAEALDNEQRAYQIRLRELGEEHENIISSLDALAGVSLNLGDYRSAERYSRESLRLSLKLHGDGHPETINSLSDLSSALDSLGNYEQAMEFSGRALAMARNSEHVETADLETYVRRAANNLQTNDRLDEAEALYKESLELSRKVYGETHPNVAIAVDNLAIHYDGIGEYDLAEPLYRQALEMLREVYGPDHPEVAQTMGNVAGFLIDSGRDTGEARELLLGATEIDSRVRPDHRFIASYMESLAYLESSLDQHAEAEDWWRKALEIYSKSLPTDHPFILSANADLGWSLLVQEKFEQAEAILVACYDVLLEENFDRELLMDVSEDLILLYEKTGDLERARTIRASLEAL